MTNDQFPINDQISNDSNTRRILWMLVAYVFFFVVMMILGAKKGDRYVLPVFPALDVLAVFGLAVVAGLLANFQFSIFNFQKVGRRTVFGALAGVVVVVLGVTVVSYHPYTIAYSNPLLPDNLSQELGWGEGLEQVAAWLNENAPEAVVASWYPEELGAYTSAQVAHINAHEQGRVRYIVLYHNMFGRAPDHYANDFIDEYYKKRLPAYVAQVAGKDYVWVYEKRVYERVVGELVPGLVVEQQDGVSHNMIGVDVLVATYSGKAQAGELAITVRDVNGVTLGQATHAVADIEDNSWVGLKLPEPIVAQDVVVEVQARGTVEDDAPTLRYTRDYEYRPTQMEIAGEAKEGDLGIRFRYVRDGVEFTEDDTRLLYSSP